MNRAASPADHTIQSVPCETLDRLCGTEQPSVLKADIEGYELPALHGATAILSDNRLGAVILELKDHGARYGFDEGVMFALMEAHGFAPFTYDPLTRRLRPIEALNRKPANKIFLRNAADAAIRLHRAPRRRLIWGQTL
jgi:hypothetical protein